MRKQLIFGLLFLAGCNRADVPSGGSDVGKWTDPETGCVYLIYGRGIGDSRVGSLSIRHRRDGSADCPGSEEETPLAR